VYTDKCYQECHILNRIMDMVQYITVVCITIFAVPMFTLLGGFHIRLLQNWQKSICKAGSYAMMMHYQPL
jgi:hypothetical protein